MSFPDTVPCCGAPRAIRWKYYLGAFQNILGANPAYDPGPADTFNATIRKIAGALGMVESPSRTRQQMLRDIAGVTSITFPDCCRNETWLRIVRLLEAESADDGFVAAPVNAILDGGGGAILDGSGNYILG